MPVPQQLPQITVLWVRHPDPRKVIFPQQSQQQSGVLTVGLLLADSLGLDLRRIPDPQLDTQLGQQPLEPAGVSGRFHSYATTRRSCRQFPVKLLDFSLPVVQLPFPILSRFWVYQR